MITLQTLDTGLFSSALISCGERAFSTALSFATAGKAPSLAEAGKAKIIRVKQIVDIIFFIKLLPQLMDLTYRIASPGNRNAYDL